MERRRGRYRGTPHELSVEAGGAAERILGVTASDLSPQRLAP
ncbi:hypothetical protein ACVNS2_28915 [Paenibacillus caseinilyticus]|nr:hypothetical protein [Paenibacillus mucilaginosus]